MAYLESPHVGAAMEQQGRDMNGSAESQGSSLAPGGSHVRRRGYASAGRRRGSAVMVYSLAFLFQSPFAYGQGGDPARGEKLVNALGCLACHTVHGEGGGEVKAPEWTNIFGTTEQLEGGASVLVDEAYLRESIQNPDIKVVKGYPAGKMPPKFKFLPEADLAGMVAYIKSLTVVEPAEGMPVDSAPAAGGASETVAAASDEESPDAGHISESSNMLMGLFAGVAICAFALGTCPPPPRHSTDLSNSRKLWTFPWPS